MERSSMGAACRRATLRFTASLALVTAGAFAGCSGNHFNAVPAAPPAGEESPIQPGAVQSSSVQYRGALQVVRGHVTPGMRSAPLVGNLPLRQQLHLAIGLPLRDRATVTSLVQGLTDPHSRNYRHYLTPAEFESRFSPTENDYRSVIRFARASGLTVAQTYPARVVLDVEGSVDAIQRAFHVTLQTRRRADGSTFYAPDREPAVALRTPILHIAGLDNEYVPKPSIASIVPAGTHSRGGLLHPACCTGSGPGGLFAGSDFRNAYATNLEANGSFQCVGVLEFDSSFFPSDVSAYQTQFGLQLLAPQPILLDGYNGQPQVGPGERETALDIEVSQAMAVDINGILVYEGSLADSMLAAMTSSQPRLCNQLSASWNFGVDSTSQQLVDQMALQKQSFYVSSGDSGGFVSDTNDDRDMSNTVVVGGTELTLNADFRWQSETAWPGSGGGVETSQYVPIFQRGVKLARGGTPHKRMIPDVAMVADSVYLIADQGVGYAVSGTSISTPLWAGYTAIVNDQARIVNGQSGLGFPDPPLYTIARDPAHYATAFHDITSGNNGAFSALPGYDLVTGWGSPQASLVSALNPKLTKNFDQVTIVVYTGNDDLRPDSDLQAAFKGVANLGSLCLMRSNNGKPSGWCTGNLYGDVNGTQGWPSWSKQTLTYTNRFGNWKWSGSGTMTLTLNSHNNGFETNDNWDLQAMSVTLSNTTTNTSVTLFNSGPFYGPQKPGLCYWRFQPTGSPPAIAQTFNLLPATTPSNGCPNDN